MQSRGNDVLPYFYVFLYSYVLPGLRSYLEYRSRSNFRTLSTTRVQGVRRFPLESSESSESCWRWASTIHPVGLNILSEAVELADISVRYEPIFCDPIRPESDTDRYCHNEENSKLWNNMTWQKLNIFRNEIRTRPRIESDCRTLSWRYCWKRVYSCEFLITHFIRVVVITMRGPSRAMDCSYSRSFCLGWISIILFCSFKWKSW
jgi:hypothetical protein